MHDKIVPVFIPHFGCPHDCIFCNQRKITNYRERIDVNQTKKYIDRYLTYFDQKKARRQISFYGGSFTGLPENIMRAYLEVAAAYVEEGKVDSLRCSTRPDYISQKILDILKEYHVQTIELGVQSTNDRVLSMNERGHTVDDIDRASHLIQKNSFELGLQMMTGMYGSSPEKDMQTCESIIQIKPDFVRIYPTLVIRNTKLQQLYEKGLYHALTVEETVELVQKIYAKFLVEKIPVVRIGLQPSKDLERDVLTGPYHPALRQLIEESLYRKSVVWKLPQEAFSELLICAPKEEINYLIGNKASNKKFFLRYYALDKIQYEIGKTDIQLIADNKLFTYRLTDYLAR